MQIRKITSVSNPKIREVLDIKKKRSEYRHIAFLIEGPRLIDMAISSGNFLKEVFYTSAFLASEDGKQLLKTLSNNIDDIFEVSGHIIDKLSDTETPQGIIAVVSSQPFLLEELILKDNSFLVVIDGVQDPGNLGTIIRTSDAAGVDAMVILPGTCDAFMPKTIRSTAGSIFNIPIIRTSTEKLLQRLHEKNIKLVVTSADAERSVYETGLTGPLAMVFGNEAHGVSSSLKRSADKLLSIPIYGKAESLNVATSAAICLYEALRQRKAGTNSGL